MVPFEEDEEMLTLEDAAQRFGVDVPTVVDWCHKGNLPAKRIGGSWRVRRTALELFLQGLERPDTLMGQLYAFLRVVPDNLLAITQTTDLSNHLDAAFFKAGETRGGLLVKYHSEGPGRPSLDELRAELELRELEVARLEEDGRLLMRPLQDPTGGRVDQLEQLLEESAEEGRTVWVDYNWDESVDVETALKHQEEISEFVRDKPLVVKTSVLEASLEEWPGTLVLRAQAVHSGSMWLTERGLALSRVEAPSL
jgi:excisionase family DNA binding protein